MQPQQTQPNELVHQLTLEDKNGYDKPFAKSNSHDGKKINWVSDTFDPTVGQSTMQPILQNVGNLVDINVAQSIWGQTKIPNRTFDIPMNVGSKMLTADSEIRMQFDLVLTSTVGAELNPATAIFGKEYYND